MIEHSFTAMGSTCRFLIDADESWAAALAISLAEDEVRRIERKYSFFAENSYLSEINRHAAVGAPIEIDEETADLLDFSAVNFQRSGGLFDVTAGILRRAYDFRLHKVREGCDIEALVEKVGFGKLLWREPSLGFAVPGLTLDFGGICKEYAVDRAAAILRDHEISAGLVDLGGDIAVTGPTRSGDGWIIDVRDPSLPANGLSKVRLSAGAIATSGDYEQYVMIDDRRYGHIINPRTGIPSFGMISATAIATSCMAAGAATTIAILKGNEGWTWLGEQGLPFLALTAEGTLINQLPTMPYMPD